MEDLERREKKWEQARAQEESARAKLQREIERLRQQAAEREAKAAAEHAVAAAPAVADAAAAASAAAAAAGMPPGPGSGAEVMDRLGRTLKVSWSRREGEYTAPQLRQIFAAHGGVEDVVMREGKKKKGSALMVMATTAAAAAAAISVNGDLSRPLLVMPLGKVAGAVSEAGDGADLGRHASAAAYAAGAVAAAAPPQLPALAAGGASAAAPVAALGARPSVPLFAAGANARHAATPSLFPGSDAISGTGSALNGSRPLFAGNSGTTSCSGTGASRQVDSFTSFKATPFPSFTAGTSEGLQDASRSKLRQAEERKRLIAQIEAGDA